jgi:threonine/homoserine/homoserine lactone efflux protein
LLPEFPRFLAFALAGLALNLVPGADMTYVIASAARGGARGGTAAALGIGAGALVHVAAAVLGLSAIIASSEALFSALKWIGAAYLLYLAIGMLRGGGDRSARATPTARGHLAVFRTGAMINILNPKVGLFFLAFLPQFVDPASRAPWVQITMLGLWFDLVGTLVNVAVAVGAAHASMRLKQWRWSAATARWIGATAMGGLAIQLLASERR